MDRAGRKRRRLVPEHGSGRWFRRHGAGPLRAQGNQMRAVKRTIAALALLSCVGATFAQSGAQPGNPDASKEDWIVLFNGKDLAGWTPKIAKHELGDNFEIGRASCRERVKLAVFDLTLK